MKRLLYLTLFFLLIIIKPVYACSPIFNSAYPAMLAVWLVWLLMAAFLSGKDKNIFSQLKAWFFYPVSLCLFLVEIPNWLTLINIVYFISLPVNNLYELISAIILKNKDRSLRIWRLVLYGISTFLTVVSIIAFRGMYYTTKAGFIQYIFDRGFFIFSGALLVGIIVFSTIDSDDSDEIEKPEEAKA